MAWCSLSFSVVQPHSFGMDAAIFCKYFYPHSHSFLFLLKNNNLNGISSFETFSNDCHVTFYNIIIRERSRIYHKFERFPRQKQQTENLQFKSKKKRKKEKNVLCIRTQECVRVRAHIPKPNHKIICTIYWCFFFLLFTNVMWITHCRVDWKFVYFRCACAHLLWTETPVWVWNLAFSFFFSFSQDFFFAAFAECRSSNDVNAKFCINISGGVHVRCVCAWRSSMLIITIIIAQHNNNRLSF